MAAVQRGLTCHQPERVRAIQFCERILGPIHLGKQRAQIVVRGGILRLKRNGAAICVFRFVQARLSAQRADVPKLVERVRASGAFDYVEVDSMLTIK